MTSIRETLLLCRSSQQLPRLGLIRTLEGLFELTLNPLRALNLALYVASRTQDLKGRRHMCLNRRRNPRIQSRQLKTDFFFIDPTLRPPLIPPVNSTY